jgi:microcystin-dependent protein
MKTPRFACLEPILVVFALLLAGGVSAQQNNANLRSLTLSAGILTPTFAPNDTEYSAGVAYAVTNLTVTADADAGSASIAMQFNGGGYFNVGSGSPSGPLALNVGTNLVEVRVTSGNFSVIKIYRIVVTRSGPPPPEVQTLTGVVAAGIVTLNGVANPQGNHATAWFEWGPTTNYGNATPPQPVGVGFASTNFAQSLTNLASHAHHFRAVASNFVGVAFGSDAVFTLTNGLSVASGPAGAAQPIALGQPVLELNYIICTNGSYPSSDDYAEPPFLGEVRLFAGNFAPAGWMFCQGQLLNITNYTALFSIIGSTFGLDSTNQFALPDTRARVLVTAGEPIGMSEFYLGQQSGAAQTVLGGAFPVHTHPLPPFYGNAVSGPAGNVSFPRANRSPYITLYSLVYMLGNFPDSAQTTYEPFMGQITMFAGRFGFPNAGRTEGQVLAINNNTTLYSIIRTTFGGNGTTTFALPDLRGRVGMGSGPGPGLTARTFGAQIGSETVVITTNQMASHQHPLPSLPPMVWLTSAAGGNQPQPLIQPSLVVKFIISTNGEIPSPFVQATNKMIGQIQLYAGTNVPGGWMLCEGQTLNVASYPALFGVVSNFYGGDGVTTFSLPDLRGRIPVGAPTGQPGATYGAESFVMSAAQLPPHTHSVPALDYQSWCDLLGIFGDAAAFAADADGDGVSNGFEWATGTGLTNAASFTPLTIAAVGDQARLRFSRNTNATDVSIHLQRTATVANPNAWSGLVTNALGVWSWPDVVTETGTNSVKAVEVSDALTNNPAADYRLMITRP